MSQTTIDLIQSFAILCIAFACIANALCLPRLKDYDERFSIVYWVLRIKAHFQRSSSTGFGQSSETGKQAKEKDLSCSPEDVSKTSDSQPTAQDF
jgi:hypothetical protein